MLENTYSVVGLMSGTSLDGLDIAHCLFNQEGHSWTFTLENTKTIPYSNNIKNRLKKANDLGAADLLMLNNEYGVWLGQQVKDFIAANKINIDFVTSHGHTVFHQPNKKLTYQIGSGQELANACKTKVICDFRTLDVSLDGQGAPLVPIGDRLLFSKYDYCLNLGGIANISFESGGERVAYDISPANMLLNYLTNKIGKEWDDRGDLARSGKVEGDLLEQLSSLAFYQLEYPKSLGYEWFKEEVITIMEKSVLSIPDKLCTSVHHIAQQIAKETKTSLLKSGGSAMIVTGGGARNNYLVECLKNYSKGVFKVIVPQSTIIDFKEALIFGFLGVLRIRNEINCLKSVTGARKDSSSGIIYEPY